MLSPDVLVANARAATALQDFGDPRFLDALQRFTTAMLSEGHLHEFGVSAQAQSLHGVLVNRLLFEDDRARHPAIAAEDVSDPIIIAGMPRTGSTKLQRLLAEDPRAQRTEFWRIVSPGRMPFDGDAEDPRIALADQALEGIKQAAPGYVAAHPVSDAREVDEDIHLQQLTLESIFTAMTVRAPSLLQWVLEGTQETPYAYERVLLQYLQWQDGGARGRHWVLKSPIHVGNLDLLAANFPNATFVHCHRDLDDAMPSFLQLVASIWEMSTSSRDPIELRDQWVPFWAGELQKNVRSNCRAEGRVIDVHYSDVLERPLEVVRRVYERRNLPLTTEAENAMCTWQARNPQHAHGRHGYSLEQFGLTQQQIRHQFADYLDFLQTIGR